MDKKPSLLIRIESRRKTICLHCGSKMGMSSQAAHFKNYHPELMKISYFDLIPGTDFSYIDDYEWASFLLKHYPDYLTPELTQALMKPPKLVDEEL